MKAQPPKTDNSMQKIALSPETMELLKQEHDKHPGKTIRNAIVQAALKIDPLPIPEQAVAAEQHIDTPEIIDISAVRFAEETAENAPEESPLSRHGRPRVPLSNWWSDEYKLARLKQAGGKDSPPIPEEAYRLMLAEAEKGNGLAMHDVGKMLRTGQGCNQDEKAAQEWFQKAYDAYFVTLLSTDVSASRRTPRKNGYIPGPN